MTTPSQRFTIGFWHPFGPHAGETAEQILLRKSREVEANGWTLWSFQIRQTLSAWQRQIRLVSPDSVQVFCSNGTGSKEPASDVARSARFKFVGEDEWRPVPEAIQIPHHFGKGTMASAFVVGRIVYPVRVEEPPPIQWLKDGDTWRSDKLPTRPEYLIRRGGSLRMPLHRAVLELMDPYLAVVSTGS